MRNPRQFRLRHAVQHQWTLVLVLAHSLVSSGGEAHANDGGPSDETSPVKIDPGVAQLFVDDYLIADQQGLKRTLHQPVKDDGGNVPVLAIDPGINGEFDGTPGTLQANGTVVYDSKLKKWVMFAIGFSSMFEGPDRVRLFRFTSPDAMSWTKGDDGTPQQIKFDLTTNADPAAPAAFHDLFSCYYDAQDERYPYKGWLWIWRGGLDGLHYVYSADGRNWERGKQLVRSYTQQVKQDGRVLQGPSDVTIFYHDKPTDRFLASIKFDTSEPVNGNHLRSRAYMFVDRLDAPLDMSAIDRVEFVPPAAEADGEQPHDQYYGSTGWRYGSHWLGGLKVWHGKGDYPYSAAGSAFLKFASSRDGLRWDKVRYVNDDGVPEVFIPNGPEGGNGGRNDGGYMTEFSQGPLRIGDELIYYYGCSSYGKNHPNDVRVSGGGVFRARLRPDGFVSVDSGTLTTRLLAFTGEQLTLNSTGPVEVEVLTPAGESVAKTSVSGDSLKHAVSFDGKGLRDLLPQGAVRLRFSVKPGAKLYSFTVR